eukprot:3881440-Pleurochrysis_carterae.AAC.2
MSSILCANLDNHATEINAASPAAAWSPARVGFHLFLRPVGVEQRADRRHVAAQERVLHLGRRAHQRANVVHDAVAGTARTRHKARCWRAGRRTGRRAGRRGHMNGLGTNRCRWILWRYRRKPDRRDESETSRKVSARRKWGKGMAK